jgi:transposase
VAASPTTTVASSAPAVSPCVTLGLHVRLPNGVQFDLDRASLETVSDVVRLLGRLPCSGSMQD